MIEGRFVKSSATLLHRDGTERNIEFASSPIASGDEVSTISVLIDVTDRLAAESKVAAAQKRYRKLFETSRDGMAFLSLEGTFAEVNGSMCEMFDYSKQELESMRFSDLRVDPLHREELLEHFDQLTRKGFTPAPA